MNQAVRYVGGGRVDWLEPGEPLVIKGISVYVYSERAKKYTYISDKLVAIIKDAPGVTESATAVTA